MVECPHHSFRPLTLRCFGHPVFDHFLDKTVNVVGPCRKIPTDQRVAGERFEYLIKDKGIAFCVSKHGGQCWPEFRGPASWQLPAGVAAHAPQ